MAADEPIEAYLDQLMATLPADGRLARRTLAEAEQHLLESADDLEAGGLSRFEAEQAAIAAFGPQAVLARRGGAPPWRDLVRPMTGLAGAGLLAIGVSGVVSEVMGRVWGAGFVAGDPPGSAYTSGRCAEYQEYFPNHDCLSAAAMHHWGEVVQYRVGAGVLGVLVLLVWRLLPRRRRLPAGYLPAAGLVVFAAAALLLGLESVNYSANGWTGAGQWLSASLVSALSATAYAAWWHREVRAPQVTSGSPTLR
jgi:hypothetical protein